MIPPRTEHLVVIPARALRDREFALYAAYGVDFTRSQIAAKTWCDQEQVPVPALAMRGILGRLAVAAAFVALYLMLTLAGGCAAGPDAHKQPPSLREICTPYDHTTEEPQAALGKCGAMMVRAALDLPVNPSHCGLIQPFNLTGAGPYTWWSECDGVTVSDTGVVRYDGDQVGLADVTDCTERADVRLLCIAY